jgi:ABC-type multidrug transport system permease subunit
MVEPGILLATTLFMVIFFAITELIRIIKGETVQYSLRNLFITTTLVAIALGFAAYVARK